MPELTVASTTDTQKEIDAVAGIAQTEPEEPEQETPEGEEPGEHEQPAEQPEEGEKPPKTAFQKRIDRLRREKGDLEREVEELRRFKAEKTRPEPEKKAPVRHEEAESETLRAKPTLEDTKADGSPKYETYEEWVEDLSAWKAEERDATRTEREIKAEREARVQEQVAGYNEAVESFKDEHPDFDKVVSQDITLPQAAVDAIVRLGEPAIAYYLGQNPEICQELTENVDDPLYVVTKIGQIAAELQREAAPEPEEEEEEPAPKAKAVSRAPAPIKPVRGSSTRSSVPLDELPYAEYRKIRERQIKDRYRRS